MKLLIKNNKFTWLGLFLALLFAALYIPIWALFHPKEFLVECKKAWFR